MEKRLALALIVVGWGFIVCGSIVFCSFVWNVLASQKQAGQTEIANDLIGAAMAAFVAIAGILFVWRSRRVLDGNS